MPKAILICQAVLTSERLGVFSGMVYVLSDLTVFAIPVKTTVYPNQYGLIPLTFKFNQTELIPALNISIANPTKNKLEVFEIYSTNN
jgi:hypothetical protein